MAVKFAKVYAGNAPKSFYVSDGRAKGKVDYTPNKHFLSDSNVVEFPQVGADANDLVVGGGQRVNMGTLSKEDFMEIDPFVRDKEQTKDRIVAEKLEGALLAGIEQQAATGQIPPKDVAAIMEAVKNDRADLAKAVSDQAEKQQETMMEQQGGPMGAPAPPGGVPPEQSLGGAPAGPPGLADLLGALG